MVLSLAARFAVVVLLLFVIWTYITHRRPDDPGHFGGHVEPGFEAVERAFRRNFAEGLEPDGAAFAVCHRGRMVVDIWGGYADKEAARLWKRDTITTTKSVTKAVVALCIARLVDQGFLSYDHLVTKYWPQFGANGKGNVTVKMLVSHQAGLMALDEEITKEAVADWTVMSGLFERQRPNWHLRTDDYNKTTRYHTITFGFLCDQLVRRSDPKRRSVGQYFREEIAEPFGIDLYLGLPRDQHHRVAYMTKTKLSPWAWLKHLTDWSQMVAQVGGFFASAPEDDYAKKAVENPAWLRLTSANYFPMNDPDIREMEIPAANSIGTARALAGLLCLLGDEHRPLLRRNTLDLISTPAVVTKQEAMLGSNVTWGYGFVHTINPQGKYLLGHPGYGGQNAKFDRHQYLAFAYLRNNMALELGEDVRSFANLQQATYESIRETKNSQ